MLTYEYLNRILAYDPETGIIRWVKNGKIAGWSDPENGGRISIRIDKKLYLAHRVAWFLYYGEWPSQLIDHENRDPTDNRISNLRPSDQSENLCNRGPQKNNSCGYKGIWLHKPTGRWTGRIQKNGKSRHLGYHDTAEEAHEAYKKAAEELHGGFACFD